MTNNAILVGEEDWRSIQETIYLFSIPGMAESIIERKKYPLKNVLRRLNSGLENSFYPASR